MLFLIASGGNMTLAAAHKIYRMGTPSRTLRVVGLVENSSSLSSRSDD